MDFERFSKKTAGYIDQELKRLLKDWRSEVGKINEELLSLVDKFIKANEGGKRIRGVLAVLGWEIGKESSVVGHQSSDRDKTSLTADSEVTPQADEAILKAESSIFKVAAAYEVFHTALLAHDDIIDQSLLRRNQPSFYQALGGDHRGISLAITLADAGFFLALKIISEANFPDQEKIEALKWFSKTMLDTSMGQILDIEKGDSLVVAKYKTAKYTVAGPLVLGAILGGAKLDQLVQLDQFGESLGIAFQIQDDILDSEVDWLGGVNSAKKEAEKYKNQALKMLPEITKDKKMSKLLERLAEYLVERNK